MTEHKKTIKLEGLALFSEMLRNHTVVSEKGFLSQGPDNFMTPKTSGLALIDNMIYYKEDIFPDYLIKNEIKK